MIPRKSEHPIRTLLAPYQYASDRTLSPFLIDRLIELENQYLREIAELEAIIHDLREDSTSIYLVRFNKVLGYDHICRTMAEVYLIVEKSYAYLAADKVSTCVYKIGHDGVWDILIEVANQQEWRAYLKEKADATDN